ncbi:DUF3500 domain-containing protein [Arthrobacter sp. NEB 688]|uniref:DUF3500 domain-containing protein n=1 Tax=Arthrobacter sp. NEB 688 TaxID=904039 RepID=UPI0015673F0D|nr:DUF3500 domain-containing protein [Arthrobacter sp. NEB 688]QKE85154.1 DUF3500 domain-containing protein [Arthrobacter sp. NEB 688]
MTTPTASLPHAFVSRRWFLGGAAVATAALAGCAAGSSGSTSAGTTATAASSATATGEAASGSVAALAQAFLATLTDDQQATTLLDYTLTNAQAWSNLPQALLGASGGGPGGGMGNSAPRVGLSIGELSDEQLSAFETLLKAATGSKTGLGYDEITQHLNADDYLEANGGGNDYGRANYYVAILGSPQDSGTWEFQFGGHHLAVANTYTDGALAGATPSFRGIEPNAAFDLNGTTNQPMKVKEAAFQAMLAGLSDDQLSSARLSDTFSDLVLGPGQDWSFPTDKLGVQVSTLSSEQKDLVLAAVATYVEDVTDADAATILTRYTSELDQTYIAYSGTTQLTEQNDYVRIDGPSVWIEFSMQRGIVLSGNHPHSLWRDRTTDYGGTKS